MSWVGGGGGGCQRWCERDLKIAVNLVSRLLYLFLLENFLWIWIPKFFPLKRFFLVFHFFTNSVCFLLLSLLLLLIWLYILWVNNCVQTYLFGIYRTWSLNSINLLHKLFEFKIDSSIFHRWRNPWERKNTEETQAK